MRIARAVAVTIVFLMVFSTFFSLASASIHPEVRANMEAYYTHEAPWMVDGPEPDEETSSRSDSRDIVRSFDLDVSFGWDATSSEFSQWDTEFVNANKKLYDGTDGQMVFRTIHLYNNRDKWSSVDVHLNNQNGRAYTYRGGILYSNLYIELFRNDVGMGGKVVQHEFGHYGLFLPDEYTDSHGPFCKCTMGTTYNTNEWCTDDNHCDYDPTYCASHGEAESCYGQIHQRYPAVQENTGSWVAGPYDAPEPNIIWHFPDLYTSDDRLRVTPDIPKAGEEVTIELDVYNKENMVNKNVDVVFYDAQGGSTTTIGTKSVYVSGYMTTAQMTWTATPGSHTIKAEIDPNNVINEITKVNNTAQRIIEVNAPPDISSSLQELKTHEDTDLEVDLSKYESDVEDGSDSPALKWTVTDHDDTVITSIIGENSDDDVLTFKPKPDFGGSTTVEMTLTDSADLSTSKDVKLTWTPINDAPLIDTLELSLTSIFRLETTLITMTGGDIEDDMDQLTAEIEYKPSDLEFWTPLTVLFSGTVFDTNLITDAFSGVGFYDLRARLTDTDALASEYFYLNGSLEVKNNPPIVTEVILGDDVTEVYRTEDLPILVFGNDLETPLSYLVPVIQYSICGEDDWTLVVNEEEPEFIDDYWEVIFVPDTDMESEDYCFLVQLEDDIGDRSSFYITDEISVLNNPPEVTSIEISEDTVYRTEVITITVKGSDKEDKNEALSLELNYKLANGGSWEAAYIDTVTYDRTSDSWAARFMPPKHARPGEYLLSARLTDDEDDSGEWFEPTDVEIEVLNNEPTASIKPMKTLTSGQKAMFDATGSSDLEDTGLIYTWDFGDKRTGKGLKPTHAYTKGGKYTVTLTVTDSDDGKATTTLQVTVNEASIFTPGDDATGLGAAAIGGILAVIIIVVIVVVLLVMRKMRSKQEPPPPPVRPEGSFGPPSDDLKYEVEGHPAYGEEERERFYE